MTEEASTWTEPPPHRAWLSFLLAIPFAALYSFVSWWLGQKLGANPKLAWLKWEGAGTIAINSISSLTFFVALMELAFRWRVLTSDSRAFGQRLLPEDEQTVIDQGYIKTIFMKVKQLPSDIRSAPLPKTIELCAARYQTGSSVSEISDAMKIHLENESARADTGYSLVRYLAWAIPSIGFIGTVMGLSEALGYFGGMQRGGPEGGGGDIMDLMVKASGALMFAFNTTFVALVNAIILMFVYHQVLKRDESLMNRVSEYCLHNFIMRAYYAPKR